MKPAPHPHARHRSRAAFFSLLASALLGGGCLSEDLGPVRNADGKTDPVFTSVRDALGLSATLPAALSYSLPSFSGKQLSGREVPQDSLDWLRDGAVTRDEVESHLGKPWQVYEDLGVMVYYSEIRVGYEFRLAVFLPVPVDDVSQFNYFFVKLDRRGHVAAHGFFKGGENDPVRKMAGAWVAELWLQEKSHPVGPDSHLPAAEADLAGANR